MAEPAASTKSSNPAPLGLYFETKLKQEVTFEGKRYLLFGFVDYSFGHAQRGSGSGNFVVVEAKRRYHIGLSYGQLIAYMGLLYLVSSCELGLTRCARDDP